MKMGVVISLIIMNWVISPRLIRFVRC